MWYSKCTSVQSEQVHTKPFFLCYMHELKRVWAKSRACMFLLFTFFLQHTGEEDYTSLYFHFLVILACHCMWHRDPHLKTNVGLEIDQHLFYSTISGPSLMIDNWDNKISFLAVKEGGRMKQANLVFYLRLSHLVQIIGNLDLASDVDQSCIL